MPIKKKLSETLGGDTGYCCIICGRDYAQKYTQAELDEAVRAERIRAKTEAYMNLIEVVKSWTMREIKGFEK